MLLASVCHLAGTITMLCLVSSRISFGNAIRRWSLFLARQERRFFFAAASLSGKSVRGSHGGMLVAPRSTQKLGMGANVAAQKIEWKALDLAA